MNTTTFRRSAHRRFTRDIPRGRLLLQLAIVAETDAERIGCPDDRQPARWHLLSAEEEAEHRRLRALCSELVAQPGRLGVTGWTDAAFSTVRAAARPLIEAGDVREHLTWQVACALEGGAVLVAPTCTVGPLCLATGSPRPAYALPLAAAEDIDRSPPCTCEGEADEATSTRPPCKRNAATPHAAPRLRPWGAWWPRAGYRIIAPQRDAEGYIANVRARTIDPNAKVKARGPGVPEGEESYSGKGIVLACPFAAYLLGTGQLHPQASSAIVVVEGEPDWMSAKLRWPGDTVIGLCSSGAWTDAIARRIPDATTVAVWTDQDDAGDRYAEHIARTLAGRNVAIVEWQPEARAERRRTRPAREKAEQEAKRAALAAQRSTRA